MNIECVHLCSAKIKRCHLVYRTVVGVKDADILNRNSVQLCVACDVILSLPLC